MLEHTLEVSWLGEVMLLSVVIFPGQVSIQLTSPSNPPADVKLHQIVSFLHGNNQTATTWADASVANELGVASAIGNVWRNGRSNLTDFVIRRYV